MFFHRLSLFALSLLVVGCGSITPPAAIAPVASRVETASTLEIESRKVRPAPSPSPTPVPTATPTPVPTPSTSAAPVFGPNNFVLGANLPWVSYGNDFGANAWHATGGVAVAGQRAQLDSALSRLAGQGVRHTRWFMLCDGRSGIRFAADGTPLGLDAYFFADVDAALASARQYGVKVTFALLDFTWFQPAEIVNGVQMKGRREVVRDPATRQALLDNVIKPILQRYGTDPNVLAWDVINEPEWATYGVANAAPEVSISRDEMRAFLAQTVNYIHLYTRQQATVGSAGTYWLDLVRGLGLDFYQSHWYDYMESYAPLAKPVAELNLDRPIILGEFPTNGAQYGVQSILDTARAAGYGGAMSWAATLSDDKSSFLLADPILGSWASAYSGFLYV